MPRSYIMLHTARLLQPPPEERTALLWEDDRPPPAMPACDSLTGMQARAREPESASDSADPTFHSVTLMPFTIKRDRFDWTNKASLSVISPSAYSRMSFVRSSRHG